MVVVPTSHDVTLDYGTSGADNLGELATVLGFAALAALALVPWSHDAVATARTGMRHM